MIIPGGNLLSLIRSIFYGSASSSLDPEYFMKRAILTPKNKNVKTINDLLLTSVPGRTVSYTSHNHTCDDENLIVMPAEILSTIESGFLPLHQLELKVGSPIMVIRNIDPAAGLCNGTRMIVNSLGTNIIEATISTGPNKGDVALIPKIKFITSATEGLCPVDFQRTQFSVRLSFAMTINKAQGQTLASVGLYLPCLVLVMASCM